MSTFFVLFDSNAKLICNRRRRGEANGKRFANTAGRATALTNDSLFNRLKYCQLAVKIVT